MTAQEFMDNFGALADAPGGIKKLRELVLELAVRGKLGQQRDGDEPAEVLLSNANEARKKLIARGALREGKSDSNADHAPRFELPLGWAWSRIGGVFDVGGGIQKTPARAPKQNHYPYLRVENVQRGRLDLERVERYELQAEELERWRLERGDLLVVEGNGSETEIGRCAIWDGSIENCVHQNHLIRCRPIEPIWSRYVLLFLNSPTGMAEMRELAVTTSGLYNLSVGKIRGIHVPFAPLAEQKRIVAKVDQLMALLDDLEARQGKRQHTVVRATTACLDALTTADSPEEVADAWKRVTGNWRVLFDKPEAVRELREAVLELAVRGRLSSSTRSSWAEAVIAEVAECRLGKMLDKAKNRGTPLPYLRNTNVHWFRLALDDIKHMPFESHELDEYELLPGDLVVCEGGHGIGRTAVWNGEISPMMFQKALHRLRARAMMNSTFLAYQLKVAADTGVMASYFTGAGIPHLTGCKLAEMAVVIPPLVDQMRIVAKVDQLMELCNDLEAKLRRRDERAGKLVEAVVGEIVGPDRGDQDAPIELRLGGSNETVWSRNSASDTPRVPSKVRTRRANGKTIRV